MNQLTTILGWKKQMVMGALLITCSIGIPTIAIADSCHKHAHCTHKGKFGDCHECTCSEGYIKDGGTNDNPTCKLN
jgi:hypothetical protein